MSGKVSPPAQSDTVTINVSRAHAKDLLVALSNALQSGGGKTAKVGSDAKSSGKVGGVGGGKTG